MLSQSLTPREAAGLLGVSESTVRRWCDAGLVRQSKTAGGHRRIDRQDLERFARDRGLQIRNRGKAHTAGRGGRLPTTTELAHRLFELLAQGDESNVRNFVLELVERGQKVASLCDEIIAPAMHRVGQEWATGSLQIFEEHLATQIIDAALRAIGVTHKSATVTAVCAGLPNDPYSLGALMCSTVLRSVGYRTLLLGPQTPTEEILAASKKSSSSLIALSLNVELGDVGELQTLCEAAQNTGVRVVLGGQKLAPEVRRKLSPDYFGDSMGHLADYALRLLNEAQSAQKLR